MLKRGKKIYYESESEIILEILQTIYDKEQMQCSVHIQHIKGQQDKQQRPLSFHGYMNQQADVLATMGMRSKSTGKVDTPHTTAHLLLESKRVTSKHSTIMKENYHSIELREFMTDSNDWDTEVLDDIWWEIHGQALSSFHIENRTTLQKFIHKRWACNDKENKYYEYKTDMCKKCGDITETQLHVLQ
jgi:hypothetical protein